MRSSLKAMRPSFILPVRLYAGGRLPLFRDKI
jgi:hypothetical protein